MPCYLSSQSGNHIEDVGIVVLNNEQAPLFWQMKSGRLQGVVLTVTTPSRLWIRISSVSPLAAPSGITVAPLFEAVDNSKLMGL